MSDKTAKMKERIEQLLRKAESTTAHEAEALTAAAEKLMLKYGIEMAMLNVEGETREKIVTVKLPFEGMWQTAWKDGFGAVAEAMGVKPLNNKHGGMTWLWLIGFESDVKQTEQLIRSLQTQSLIALAEWWKSNEGLKFFKLMGYSNHQKHVEKRSFIEFFGYGASRRIREERAEVVTQTTGAELVLADRSAQIDDYTYTTYNVGQPRASRAKSGRAGIIAGNDSGYAAAASPRNGVTQGRGIAS